MKIWQTGVIPLFNKTILCTGKLIALSGWLLLGSISTASAAEVTITTEFIADLAQPQKNMFENKTPQSGFCAWWPSYCYTDEFSIEIDNLATERYFNSEAIDPEEKQVKISLNSQERDVILKDKIGNVIVGKFRLAFFGMRHSRTSPGDGNLGNLLVGLGPSPKGDCKGRTGSGGGHVYNHGWEVIPNRYAVCYKPFNEGVDYKGNVTISHFSFGYILVTPNPLDVYAGDYEGSVRYSVGKGMDIDFHDDNGLNDEIIINIKATVRHAFQIKFPSDEEYKKVSLAPRGGWGQWTNGGRVPDSLSKEVPFTLSSTSGFTVNMRCEFDSGTGCALRETTSPTGEKIPLDVSLTLPGFKTDGGNEVRNLLLNSLPAGHVIVPTGEFVVNRRSQVDFKVMKPGVETMMKSPGSTWGGVVTLVFDTQTD